MNGTAMLVACVIAGSMVTQTAFAFTSVRGTGNDSEVIYVAQVDIVGDGTHNKVPVVCFDSATAGHDRRVVLGGTSGLSDDYQIHGDSADSGTGADALIIGWATSGYCNGITDTGGYTSLLYNGFYLDLYGDGGDDYDVYDGGGSNNTYVNGGAGNDFVIQASSIGRAHGDAGDDAVWGLDGANDSLRGDGGVDCLYDSTNTFGVYDCGNDAGDAHHTSNTGYTGCPSSTMCCGFC